MRVTPLLCFPLQSECIGHCFEKFPLAAEPGEVADAKNDPQNVGKPQFRQFIFDNISTHISP